MKYRIELVDSQEEDIIVYAKQDSTMLSKIEAVLRESDDAVFGYAGDNIVKLDIKDVYCFFSESGKVYALTTDGKLQIKDRLYRLEDSFSEGFVKINQSCLVSVEKIKRFDVSIGGSLVVMLENGYKDYVSRRQVKAVKERIGF